MSHVDFKKWQYCISLSLIFCNVKFKKGLCHMSLYFTCHMSVRHAKFKNCPCHHVDLRGQGPCYSKLSGDVPQGRWGYVRPLKGF